MLLDAVLVFCRVLLHIDYIYTWDDRRMVLSAWCNYNMETGASLAH